MNPTVLAFLLLQIKHFLADYVLQTARQAELKGVYGHRAGLEHSTVQVLMTVPCLVAVGVAPSSIVLAVTVEFLIHYHQDWLKARVARKRKLTPESRAYWIVLGADQLVHQLTYVGMVWLLL